MSHRALLILSLALSLAVAATGATGRDVVVLVTCEGLSLDHLRAWELPEVDHLLDDGAIGLLHNRTGGLQSANNNAVTIGAGALAVGGHGGVSIPVPRLHTDVRVAVRGTGIDYAGEAFNAGEPVRGEPAHRLFARATGIPVPPAAVVHPRIHVLKEINLHATPGLLGRRLHDAGVYIAVYGNADATTPSRHAVTVAMLDDGWAPHGDVSRDTLVGDPARPFGVRTNYPYLLQRLTATPPGQAFLVVEAGDGGRLEAAKDALSPARYAELKRETARETFAFLAALDRRLRARTDRYLLLLAVLAPDADAAARQDVLTPIVALGSGVERGLLTSAATRRAGLVTNVDLAPTVLAFFDLPRPARMPGSPLRVTSAGQGLPEAHALNARLIEASNARRPVLIAFVLCMAAVLFMAVGMAVRRHRRGQAAIPRASGTLAVLLTAGMLAPAALLAAPGLGLHGTVAPSLFLLSTVVIAALLHRFLRDPRAVFAAAGLLVAGTLCADLAAGTPLLQQSLFSYDAIAGYRFYGIGNESAGVLLGALLLGVYALLDFRGQLRARQVVLVAAAYVVVFVLLGGPSFGADFGGMVSALPGFAYALTAARRERRKPLLVLWVSASALFLLAVMLGVHLLFRHTHIGALLAQAQAEGTSVVWEVVRRKAQLHLLLFRTYPLPLSLMVLVIIGITVSAFRPAGFLRRLFADYPVLGAGLRGMLIIFIMAMLTNDTGMAMAAAGLLYLLPPLLQLALIHPAVGTSPPE